MFPKTKNNNKNYSFERAVSKAWTLKSLRSYTINMLDVNGRRWLPSSSLSSNASIQYHCTMILQSPLKYFWGRSLNGSWDTDRREKISEGYIDKFGKRKIPSKNKNTWNTFWILTIQNTTKFSVVTDWKFADINSQCDHFTACVTFTIPLLNKRNSEKKGFEGIIEHWWNFLILDALIAFGMAGWTVAYKKALYTSQGYSALFWTSLRGISKQNAKCSI